MRGASLSSQILGALGSWKEAVEASALHITQEQLSAISHTCAQINASASPNIHSDNAIRDFSASMPRAQDGICVPPLVRVGQIRFLASNSVAPLLLPLKDIGGVLFALNDARKNVEVLENFVLRVLMSLPVCRVKVTFIGTASLGNSPLRLNRLTPHVVQILDSGEPTSVDSALELLIEQPNVWSHERNTGNMEIHLLCVCDFPGTLNSRQADQLLALARRRQSGGVAVLLAAAPLQLSPNMLPAGFPLSGIAEEFASLTDSELHLKGQTFNASQHVRFTLDKLSAEMASEVIERINQDCNTHVADAIQRVVGSTPETRFRESNLGRG